MHYHDDDLCDTVGGASTANSGFSQNRRRMAPMWLYCIRGPCGALHARELPPVLLQGRALSVYSALLLVPDRPWFPIILSTVYDRIVVHHNGLFDLNLDIQITIFRLALTPTLPTAELGPHGVSDVSRSMMPLSTLLSGICEWGQQSTIGDYPQRATYREYG